MASIETAPGLGMLESEEEVDALLAEQQKQAAEAAQNVGEVKQQFAHRIHQTLQLPGVHEHSGGDGASASEGMNAKAVYERLASEKQAQLESATDGIEDLQLNDMEGGVLGYNHIGAGRGGVNLNREIFADGDSAEAHGQHTAAHEVTHGGQVELKGELLDEDGIQVHPLLLLEGHAEREANKAVGMSTTEHREGQPEAVYAEGQNLANEIVSKVGEAAFNQTMTGDGDVSRLQGAFRSKALAI